MLFGDNGGDVNELEFEMLDLKDFRDVFFQLLFMFLLVFLFVLVLNKESFGFCFLFFEQFCDF